MGIGKTFDWLRLSVAIIVMAAAGGTPAAEAGQAPLSGFVQEGQAVEQPDEQPALFGQVVAISPDGAVAVVGQQGHGWILLRRGGSWVVYQRLQPEEGTGSTLFGESVAISSDGQQILVGDPGDENGRGSAWMFRRDGSFWVQDGPKLTGGPAEPTEGSFGRAVALSADGTTALVGAPVRGKSKSPGNAWIFEQNEGSWVRGSQLTTGHAGDEFGTAVGLSEDGSTALVGSDELSEARGAGWIYARNQTTWSQVAQLSVSGASSNSYWGVSAALAGDGRTAFLGSLNGVAVFTDVASTWQQQAGPLQGAGAEPYSEVLSLASSEDGDVVLVGEPNIEEDRGGAWLFGDTAGGWAQLGGEIEPADEGRIDGFGAVSLASDGEMALIGGAFAKSVWQFGPPPYCAPTTASLAAGATSLPLQLPCEGPPDATVVDEVVSAPTLGSLSAVNPEAGEFTYSSSQTGASDSFTYRARDQWAASNVATATVSLPAAATVSLPAAAAPSPPTPAAAVDGLRSSRSPAPRPVHPVVPRLLVRAALSSHGVGELVGIAGLRGAVPGENVSLLCVAGCARRLVERIRVTNATDASRRRILKPMILAHDTRIEVTVSAPGAIGRFAVYHFELQGRSLHMVRASGGCLTSGEHPETCP